MSKKNITDGLRIRTNLTGKFETELADFVSESAAAFGLTPEEARAEIEKACIQAGMK